MMRQSLAGLGRALGIDGFESPEEKIIKLHFNQTQV